MTETLLAIGTQLRGLRVKKGYLSHEQFAKNYDLPRIQYWRIEKGKSNLTMRSLIKVLGIHDLAIDEFFILLEITKAKRSSGLISND